ncbi:hypothetical protein CANARDRAFT_26687 [[Candida] arabinofermentans NRRL YB-2248]|uniref:Non-structural maintenance of chromosomes element 1 homolog n=1 Tax=[Candida] arabinofermentans NRRL YB-2248 TaxID=983967 RepID=A0A1E4T6C2_9ASCO|nr:hypothetical protein CANARDRAFT_26687 [[Candida] arabinofermentans NRRL YB-2248]
MEQPDTVSKEEYNDTHIALLQFLISVQCIDKTDLLVVYKQLHRASQLHALKQARASLEDGDFDAEELHSETSRQEDRDSNEQDDSEITLGELSLVISKINSQLKPLYLTVVESVDQDDDTRTHVILVNTKSSDSIKLTTSYTDKEIEIINKLIDEMFENPIRNGQLQYSIERYVAINIVKAQLGSLSEANDFLNKLVSSLWIELYNGKFTLGTRALVELKQFLYSKYEEKSKLTPNGTISKCAGCGEITTRGLSCSDRNCYVRFHKKCIELFATGHQTTICPNEECEVPLKSMEVFY